MRSIHLMKHALIAALATCCSSAASNVKSDVTQLDFKVSRFLDQDAEQACREKLMEADLDKNLILDSEEYAYYLKLASEGRVDSQFADLSSIFVLIFCTVACDTCFKLTSDQGCCLGDKANIPLNITTSVDLLVSLDFVCANVEQALETDRSRSSSPSPLSQDDGKPTIMPTQVFPTMSPLESITDAPVSFTESPTSAPVLREPSTWTPTVAPVTTEPTPDVNTSPDSSGTNAPVIAPIAASSSPNTLSPTTRVPSISPIPTTPPFPGTNSPASNWPNSAMPITATPSVSLAPSTSSPFTFEPTIETSAPVASNAPFTFEPSVATIAPVTTSAPIMVPTKSPMDTPPSATLLPSNNPTPAFNAAPVCITFSYTLQNQVGLTSDDVFNERNNTVKRSLVLATRAAVIEILNVSVSQTNTTTEDSTPRATTEDHPVRPRHFNHTSQGSSNSTWTPHLRAGEKPGHERRNMIEIRSGSYDNYLSALESALALFSNSTNRQICTKGNKEVAALNGKYVRRMSGFASRVESRHLAYYSDSLPVKIISVVDYPQCDTRGNAKIKCSLVSSKACVVLERGDDRQVIRTILRDGLKDAVNSGAIDPTYPSS